jgi:hypothetical protein
MEYLVYAARPFVDGLSYRDSIDRHYNELKGYVSYDPDTPAYKRTAGAVVTYASSILLGINLSRDLAKAAVQIDPKGERPLTKEKVDLMKERLVTTIAFSSMTGPSQRPYLQQARVASDRGEIVLAVGSFLKYVEIHHFESLHFKGSHGTETVEHALVDARALFNATNGQAPAIIGIGLDAPLHREVLIEARGTLADAKPDFNTVATQVGRLRSASEMGVWVQELNAGHVEVRADTIPVATVVVVALAVLGIVGLAAIPIVKRLK